MEIWIYGSYAEGFEREAIIDGFIALRVARKYGEVSTLDMQLAIDASGLILTPSRWLYIPTLDSVFFIESAEITDGDGGMQASIRARGAECLFDRRVIVDNKQYTNKYTSDIIAGELANIYKTAARQFPGYVSAIAPEMGLLYTKYTTAPGTFLDFMQEMCKVAGLGFRTEFNPADSTMTLSLYQGTDFSARASAPVFSPELETIYDMDFEDSIEQMCNVCYVIGELGTNNIPKKTTRTWRSGAYSGYERFEAVINFSASSNSDTSGTQVATPDASGTSAALTATQYADTMQGFGDRTLAERQRSISMSGTVNANARTYVLGVDFDLGDIVRIRSARAELSSWQRLTAIDDQWTSRGYSRALTLGSPLLGIGRLLRK
ncbi:MAG: siphovirus ReqiPepy6 Gp37-like family protein [Oscillospiraceae bacterium]|nr:siphovirus ReqiPepy6 Gp37-like family protein [Oscillospiraceae bacterium]